jgi:dihydroorotate dehydrogenase
VSSPNTPNLRQLQDRAALDEILAALCEINAKRAQRRPILVKVAPDLSFSALDEILELVGPRSLAGIVATNTTIARPETNDAACRRAYAESGGLSGAPLRERATEVIRHLARATGGRLPIVGVGGIFSVADAVEKLEAGATLVQVYSALVFEGPGLVGELVKGIARWDRERRARASCRARVTARLRRPGSGRAPGTLARPRSRSAARRS